MKNWTIILLICIVSLIVFGTIFYFLKKNKDISDLIQITTDASRGTCADPPAYAKCYVNAMLKKFGYLRTKEILGEAAKPSSNEQTFMNAQPAGCHCKK